jgi:hypothetical protein
MTEQEAKTLPLWEVWDRFKAALDMIELDDPNAPDTTMGGKWGTPPGEYGRMAAKMVPVLRSVLLERVEKVKDTYGNYDSFSIGSDAEGRPLIDIEHRGQDREDDAETARNMSAAYAFMAWELEQRQKESPN